MRLLLLVVLFIVKSKQLGPSVGPYDIEITQLSNCLSKGDGGGKIPYEVKPYFVKTAGKRKQLFKANMSFPFAKEEFYNLTINNTFFMRKNNDYLFIYKYSGNMCETAFATSKNLYNDFLEKIGMQRDECAISPGNYTITDWDPIPALPAPMLEYGTYRAKMQCILDTEVVACIEVDGEVKPKL